jgi:hypothetical protein
LLIRLPAGRRISAPDHDEEFGGVPNRWSVRLAPAVAIRISMAFISLIEKPLESRYNGPEVGRLTPLRRRRSVVARAKQVRAVYSVHPSVSMMQAWVTGLPRKTGRTLEEWIELVQDEGPETERERRAWLKTKHSLGTNAAWWIAERAEGKGTEDCDPAAYLRAAEGYVDAMFSGRKSALKPICEKLLELARGLGSDVKVCPCKTIIPLYRQHVFAEIKPMATGRIDLGFALGSLKPSARLIDTGGFEKKDRITHRIAITSLAEIDAEVKKWLRYAYDLDA